MNSSRGEIIKEVLIGIGVLGLITITGIVAPNIFGALSRGGFVKKKYNRRFNNTINYLKRRKLIIIKENPDGSMIVKLSESGKKKTLVYNLDILKIKKMKKWDGKWRLVMFDIPDKFKGRANVLRDKLKELGLYQFQKSVWVYPYPLENEIDFIAQLFEVRPFIKLGEIINLEDEYKLRKKYKLKL